MAIQMRRGNQAEFNPDLLMPGEIAVSQDTTRVYMCFTRGVVIQLAVTDTLEETLREVEAALATLNQTIALAQGYANTAKSYAVGTNGVVRDNDDTDNSKYYKEQAELSAESAADTLEDIQDVIDGVTPAFTIDYTTGHLSYALGT